MEIPPDVLSMLEGVPLRTSARNMTQLSQLLTDGTVIAYMVHRVYPRLINMHTYSPHNSVEGKLSTWKTLHDKVLSKMKVALTEDEIRVIVKRDSVDLLVAKLREIRMKMRAYEPMYNAGADKSKNQAEKDAARAKQYSANNPPRQRRNSVNRTLELDASLTSSPGTNSVVGKTMRSANEGISPPKRVRQASVGDNSRRPSRLAASIAASLGNQSEGQDILLGSAGRRASQLKRTKEREKHAKILRDSKKSIVVTESEMDEMFENITSKLNKDLDEHSERLNRLDVKSRQFDQHMTELRAANLKEMQQTDHNLANVLREEQSVVEPGFGFGRPGFVSAPQDGNNSFVGLVSPHSNQIAELVGDYGEEYDRMGEEIGREVDLLQPPPPPPSMPPPAHILEQARISRGESLVENIEEGEEEEEEEEEAEAEGEEEVEGGGGEIFTKGNAEEPFDMGILANNISNIENEQRHSNAGADDDVSDSSGEEVYDMGYRNSAYSKPTPSPHTPMGKPSPDLNSARKVRLSISGPSGLGAEDTDEAELEESATGVDWCEVFHNEHQRHYYLHHTGVSQWEKPAKGWVQCADPATKKVYYVNLASGESSWEPPKNF